MNIFVMSDIHGSRAALECALEAFARENATDIFLLGDALYHGPRNPFPEDYAPKDVADILNSYTRRIIAVRGNCDSEVDQMLIKVPIMADYAIADLNGRRAFLTHGHVYSPATHPALPEGSVFLSGHTHIPLLETRGNITYLNPGSIALPKGGYPPSYAVITDEGFWVKTLSGEALMHAEA